MGDEKEASYRSRESAWLSFAAHIDHLYRSLLLHLQQSYNFITELWQGMYHKLLDTVGPKTAGKPSSHTIVWTLFAFMFFLVFASLAVKYPTPKFKIAFILINSTVICALSLLIWRDFRGSKMTYHVHPKRSDMLITLNSTDYRRNLGNSILTILFTMVLLTVVYSLVWYRGLNFVTLQLREDILVSTTDAFLSKV